MQPKALAVYRGLAALAETQERTEHGYFIFGSEARTVAQVIAEGNSDVWARPLEEQALEGVRARIRPEDMIVVLLDGRSDVLPAYFRALVGDELQQVQKRIAAMPQGELRLSRSAAGAPVVLWWGLRKDELPARAKTLLPVTE